MDDNWIIVGAVGLVALLGIVVAIMLLRRRAQRRRDAEYYEAEQRRIAEKEHNDLLAVGMSQIERRRAQADEHAARARQEQLAADQLYLEAQRRERALTTEADTDTDVDAAGDLDLTDRTMAEQREAEQQVRESRRQRSH